MLITLVGAVSVSVGPFYDGLISRDPVAIGFMVAILAGILLVLTVAIIDRKLNPPEPRNPPKSRAGRR